MKDDISDYTVAMSNMSPEKTSKLDHPESGKTEDKEEDPREINQSDLVVAGFKVSGDVKQEPANVNSD